MQRKLRRKIPSRGAAEEAAEFLDPFPMTATGKIHKLTLRQQFKDYKAA